MIIPFIYNIGHEYFADKDTFTNVAVQTKNFKTIRSDFKQVLIKYQLKAVNWGLQRHVGYYRHNVITVIVMRELTVNFSLQWLRFMSKPFIRSDSCYTTTSTYNFIATVVKALGYP